MHVYTLHPWCFDVILNVYVDFFVNNHTSDCQSEEISLSLWVNGESNFDSLNVPRYQNFLMLHIESIFLYEFSVCLNVVKCTMLVK